MHSGSVGEATDHEWDIIRPAVVVWALPVEPPTQLMLDRLADPKLLLILLGDGCAGLGLGTD